MAVVWLVMQLGLQPNGHLDDRGEVQTIDRKDFLKEVCITPRAAKQRAKELAIASPGKQYAVFQILEIYETGTPKIIQKKLNDSNEIVLVTP